METSLAELVLVAALLYGLYRVLAPLQRRLEALILRLLGEKPMIDAEIVASKKKSPKE